VFDYDDPPGRSSAKGGSRTSPRSWRWTSRRQPVGRRQRIGAAAWPISYVW